MRILLSGATGLIGSALTAWYLQQGHELLFLVRRTPQNKNERFWDWPRNSLDLSGLEPVDLVVHLAGENVASGIWFSKRKRRIAESRILGTQLLARAIIEAGLRPRQVICASAVGFYGNRGDEKLSEASAVGSGFLSEVVMGWEQAALPLADAGISVTYCRLGLVLSPQGGLLAKMIPAFKLGLGGRLGSGDQYMSWIAIDDVVRAFDFVEKNQISGPVNLTTPHPVTNLEFTKAVGSATSRPTLFPVPAAVLKLLPGGMGEELFLASTRVLPLKLLESGFQFQYPDLKEALRTYL